MVKFLINRPIAVLMAFTACFIVGLTTYFTLPISLLPDIAIPEITIQVSGQNMSARELENTIVRTLRHQLMQVNKLSGIESEARDGSAIIRLRFDFGTNTDLAFIETNEKIDGTMNTLPREVGRPRIIKTNATDIPVFCLNLTLKSLNERPAKEDAVNYKSVEDARFMSLCEFAETVIKRRIEQLPEVAMVDITGLVEQQLQITPDIKKMEIAGLTLDDLETALVANNVELGSLKVRDGYYEYNIRFSSLLHKPEDVKNIYFHKSERLFQLKDIADIAILPAKETGLSLANGKRAVTLSIIKQSNENMDDMKKALQKITDYFATANSDIEFSFSRNQTELLDYTISNLRQNLSLGFIFICIVAILFLGDVKSPLIIGISMVVSIVISFLFFYFSRMSLNIISLSGLILALGMMIDNSIIVTENISQYRIAGYSIEESCIRGTNEVITPMLSSMFTTIVVFVPLVFMSGIAGAIFYDQAFAVTVGLLISYITGIILLPVLYKIAYCRSSKKKCNLFNLKIKNPLREDVLYKFYNAGIAFVFRYKVISLLVIIISLPLCIWFFREIPKSKMPNIDRNEIVVAIEWNENIHLDENKARIDSLFRWVKPNVEEYTAYVGQQQFLLNRDHNYSLSETELYFRTSNTQEISLLQNNITLWLHKHYPMAKFTFAPPPTIFEALFTTFEADIIAELYIQNKSEIPSPTIIRKIENMMKEVTQHDVVGPAFDNQLNMTIDLQKLLIYNVNYDEVYRVLKMAFKNHEVTTLRSYQQYLPITFSSDEQSLSEVMRHTMVHTIAGIDKPLQSMPLQAFVKITPGEDLKTITAGKNGEYVPYCFYEVDQPEKLLNDVKQNFNSMPDNYNWDINFSGSFFSNRKMLNELIVILFISILLMYLILAAQFESFLQPLIVLFEIPVGVAAALLTLWIFGHTLNLMSAIGIVVTCGIIINDSILKLNTINELRKSSKPLMEAIHEAGRRRLRPIIMTSLTTIFAMVPLLFSFDMGSELQKPLSVAMIAGMLIGTLVSLFIIPLIYWMFYRNKKQKLKLL
jgi:multidrug efflux pump subunit AcrB